jgi:hypothetical protein
VYENKTKATDQSVVDFIEQIEHPRRKEEAYQLLELFAETSGYPAKMWGPSIIGFGSVHYKYATGHEGDMGLVGFSPRKAKISIYTMLEAEKKQLFLDRLGKHTSGVGCIYVNRLTDIDLLVLKEMLLATIEDLQARYPKEE